MSHVEERAPAPERTRGLSVGSRPNRYRILVALVGAVTLAAGVAWLALPRTPGDGSAEVGFARDLLAHDTTVRDVLAELDVDEVDPETRELLSEIQEIFGAHDEQASELLQGWGQPVSTRRIPMGWMGHVLEGTTPGAMSTEVVARVEALDNGDRIDLVMTELIGHLKGAVLMARGLIGISNHDQAQGFAAGLAEERNQILDRVEAWFVARGELPPTWLPQMTTDPGNLDHGDPVTSARDVGINALRWLPVAVGVVLLARAATTGRGSRRPVLVWIACIAASLAGLGHLAVAGAHGDDAAVNGVFFVIAGVAQIGLAAVAAARPSPPMLNAAATLAGGLTLVYVAFRILSPPGSVGPADIDLSGAIIVALQLVVVAVWALRPLGGELGRWGADVVADLGVRGASAAVVVLIAGLAGVIGYTIGEADSRPPSQTDVGFAQDMISHHAQAVQMAQLVDGRLGNTTVETIAREVVVFQQYETGIFDTRLREWGENRGTTTTMEWMGIPMPLREMPGIASDAQVAMLRDAQGPELDQIFLTLLGAHHVGGVQMAAFAAENADDNGIAELAAVIARNQRLEINEFSLLMDRLGVSESTGSLSTEELAALTSLAVAS